MMRMEYLAIFCQISKLFHTGSRLTANEILIYLSQVQAVLSGSLRQETSLVLVLIALERYLAQVDFDLHLVVFSPGLTVLYILASLASSIVLYSAIVFLRSGFYLSTSSFSVSLENRSDKCLNMKTDSGV